MNDIPACVCGVLMKTYCSKATVEGIVIVPCCKIEYILVCAHIVLFIAFRCPCLLWRLVNISILHFQSVQYTVHFWKIKLISQTTYKDCCSRLPWLCQRTYGISTCCHSVIPANAWNCPFALDSSCNTVNLHSYQFSKMFGHYFFLQLRFFSHA